MKVNMMESNLYEMVSENPSRGEMLLAIGLEESGIARYRDVDVPPYARFRQLPVYTDDRFRKENLDNNKNTVIVLTRTGGGNRGSYKEWWQKIRKHPRYVSDYDATFDSTFAYVEFKCSDDVMDRLKQLDNNPEYDRSRIVAKNAEMISQMQKMLTVMGVETTSMTIREILDRSNEMADGIIEGN